MGGEKEGGEGEGGGEEGGGSEAGGEGAQVVDWWLVVKKRSNGYLGRQVLDRERRRSYRRRQGKLATEFNSGSLLCVVRLRNDLVISPQLTSASNTYFPCSRERIRKRSGPLRTASAEASGKPFFCGSSPLRHLFTLHAPTFQSLSTSEREGELCSGPEASTEPHRQAAVSPRPSPTRSIPPLALPNDREQQDKRHALAAQHKQHRGSNSAPFIPSLQKAPHVLESLSTR